MSAKIVGGERVGPKAKRFIVSLQIRTKHICGGFLATWKIVISTAFCIIYIRDNVGSSFENAFVFYGSNNLEIIRRGRHVEKIREAKPHPEYDPEKCDRNSSSDIGYVVVSL